MSSCPEAIEVQILEQELEAYLANCDVVDAAIIATPDGCLRAQQQRGAFEVERAAVMGRSLMALGDTITAELGIGACEVVIAESQFVLVLFNHVNGGLVLISVTKSKNGLGALLSWARRTADDIAKKAIAYGVRKHVGVGGHGSNGRRRGCRSVLFIMYQYGGSHGID